MTVDSSLLVLVVKIELSTDLARNPFLMTLGVKFTELDANVRAKEVLGTSSLILLATMADLIFNLPIVPIESEEHHVAVDSILLLSTAI